MQFHEKKIGCIAYFNRQLRTKIGEFPTSIIARPNQNFRYMLTGQEKKMKMKSKLTVYVDRSRKIGKIKRKMKEKSGYRRPMTRTRRLPSLPHRYSAQPTSTAAAISPPHLRHPVLPSTTPVAALLSHAALHIPLHPLSLATVGG